MQYYRQTDPRWAGDILGFNTDPLFNIGNYGCLVTAWANLLLATTGNPSWTPEAVNAWLQAHEGFEPQGGILEWAVALGMGGVSYVRSTTSLEDVNSFLAPTPNFAIIEVKNSLGNQHFVLGNAQGLVIDSEDGLQKVMNLAKNLCGPYPFVQAHLYTATAMPPAPAAAPPAPAQPTAPDGTKYTPVNATVKIDVPRLNARLHPTTIDSPIQGEFVAGTAHINGWCVGQPVTVAANGRTDDVWLLDDNGHWFTQAGTTANE